MRKVVVIGLAAAALQACATEFGPGFHLPLGDPDRGRAAFSALQCGACHAIAGTAPDAENDGRFVLGGQTMRVKTYGDLVTSIVNPSHRLARGYPADEVSRNGESPMAAARLNEVMSVQQLVDLAAFLQAEYELAPPLIEPWPEYPLLDHDRSSEWPPPRP
jgi:mono/diheme cytochrome c family protein